MCTGCVDVAANVSGVEPKNLDASVAPGANFFKRRPESQSRRVNWAATAPQPRPGSKR